MTSGPAVAVTTIVFTVLALVSVVMRLVARVGFLKNGGRDEIAIILAGLSSIGVMIATLYQVKYGLGKHFDSLTKSEFELAMKSLWVTIILYNLSLCLTKASIILQYLRVFVGSRIRLACRIALLVVIAYAIQAFITSVWSCIPIDSFWDVDKKGHCMNKKLIWFFGAAFNIFTDILIITLPMPVLSSLKLPRRQKIGLMTVFALGGFVCLVSILRLHALYVVSTSNDITLDNADAALWSNLEVNVGIICASLPTMKPLISRLFPRFLSSDRSRQGTFQSPASVNNIFSSVAKSRRMNDVEGGGYGNTITRIEAGGISEQDLVRETKRDDNGKDIFVLRSMTQDVETESPPSPSDLQEAHLSEMRREMEGDYSKRLKVDLGKR